MDVSHLLSSLLMNFFSIFNVWTMLMAVSQFNETMAACGQRVFSLDAQHGFEFANCNCPTINVDSTPKLGFCLASELALEPSAMENLLWNFHRWVPREDGQACLPESPSTDSGCSPIENIFITELPLLCWSWGVFFNDPRTGKSFSVWKWRWNRSTRPVVFRYTWLWSPNSW